jgi:hypothetical protein
MLWTDKTVYRAEPFETEADLEDAIVTVAPTLFGEGRVYLDAKRLIGVKGRTRNIPDGYLIDLSSARDPKLFIVENELAEHEALRHIAVQILEFSLSFEATPHLVKSIVREALGLQPELLAKCQEYAQKNTFEKIDFLLEQIIQGTKRFNALVVIDEIDEELETVLISRFKFPVEILTLQRFVDSRGERVFQFDPFLAGVVADTDMALTESSAPAIDPAEVDTIVVPARDEGFNDVFVTENRWYAIRIHPSMIPKIKYIAAYRVRPVSAITRVAPVASIEQWRESNKYVVNFTEPAKPIGPIGVAPNGRVKPVQSSRYTSHDRLEKAATLDDVF